MRYIGQLQRYEDAHVDVIQSEYEREAINAAIALYAALVPQITTAGFHQLQAELSYENDKASRQAAESYKKDGVSGQLRAQEWGVGVYDTQSGELSDDDRSIPRLIFWIGATRDDPKG